MSANPLIHGRRAGEIAASVDAAIRGSQLSPGDPLPPVRQLAEALGVSPATVALAYRSLQQRGLVTSSGRRGTRVSLRPALIARTPMAAPPGALNLALGNPDPALLPDLRPFLRRLGEGHRLYGDPVNREDLLEMAAAAFRADGIPPDFLAVSGGALDAIERILDAHLLPGDRVIVEDPGYPAVYDLLALLGLVPVPVPVDDAGLLPDPFEQALSRAAACVITPRAQNPFGSALDEMRTRALGVVLERAPSLLVIEDDHAGAVSGAPTHTLYRDGRERWAVVRSVSKALGPDLRVALVAADAMTVARFEARQQTGAGWVSHLLQSLVASLWRDSAVAELLARSTQAYAERRRRLIGALAAEGMSAHGRSGLNVWIPVGDEQATVRHLLDAGFAVSAGERFRIRAAPAVRISIGALEPADSDRLARQLKQPLARPQQTRSA